MNKIDLHSIEHICERDWYLVFHRCRCHRRIFNGEGFGYRTICLKYDILCRDTTCPKLKELRE